MLSAEEILQSPLKDGFRVVCCPVCYRENIVKPTTARGDPRNIAYTGHWDGWQPFNKPSHGCVSYKVVISGTISVSVAAMSKTQRSHSNQVLVVGLCSGGLFLPIHFLVPFCSEIVDEYINSLCKEYVAVAT
jgi:hypothetical protein